ETDNQVLLIDADLRKTSRANLLGFNQQPPLQGLTDLLLGAAELDKVLLKCEETNLYFLPAGKPVNNPTELLSMPALEKLMQDVRQRYGWVVIDAPPTLALADASLLMPLCDAALIVVRAEKTPTTLVKESVQRIGVENICGVLVNGVRSVKSAPYYYGNYRPIAK